MVILPQNRTRFISEKTDGGASWTPFQIDTMYGDSINKFLHVKAPRRGNAFSMTYTVPEDDNVQLTVYIAGGLIYDRPLDKYQESGTYTIEFKIPDDSPELYAAIVTGQYKQPSKFVNLP